MAVYLITFAFAAGLSHRIQTGKEMGQAEGVQKRRVFLLILVLTCVIGLRFNVGTDYASYYRGYYNYSRLPWSEFLEISDPGLRLIAKISTFIYDDPVTMFFIAALIFMTLYVVTLYRNGDDFFACIVMFFISGTFLDSCNGVRQSLAVAIIFFGFPYLRDRKFFKYLITILIATAFHSTAIIMLPVYFLLSRKTTWWRILLTVGGAVLLSFSYSYIFDMVETITEKNVNLEYSYYEQGVSIFRVAVAVAPCVLLPFVDKEKFEQDSIYINILIFNAALMCITANSAFLARVGMYSTGFLCIALPKILSDLRLKHADFIRFGVYVCYFAYWIASILLTAGLYPYHSIFSR